MVRQMTDAPDAGAHSVVSSGYVPKIVVFLNKADLLAEDCGGVGTEEYR